MKLITVEQHEFLVAARAYFRVRGEPEAAGRMRAAERAWSQMIKAEAEDRKHCQERAA